MIDHKKLISAFVNLNLRAGVAPEVVDLSAAYARQCLKSGKVIDFYAPEPNLNQLLETSTLRQDQKDAIWNFWVQNITRGVDEEQLRICIAYAGNILLQNSTVIFSEQHLADKMRIRLHYLKHVSTEEYKTRDGYISVKIPKRSGGFREIDAPNDRLKYIQRWILDHILATIPLHDAAHGFRTGRSIITNAEPHVGNTITVKLDLRDFFPTVTFPRVLGVFLDIGYAYTVALRLTMLCTYKDRLPQGSPTSPVISNLVCRQLDRRLDGLAKHTEYLYTRYADDLTFSASSSKTRPEQLIHLAQNIISDEGFECAKEKTYIHRKGARQTVTGLIVNDTLSVPREQRRKLRAIVYNSLQYGVNSQSTEEFPVFMKRLKGYAAYFLGVNKDQGKKLSNELKKLSDQDIT